MNQQPEPSAHLRLNPRTLIALSFLFGTLFGIPILFSGCQEAAANGKAPGAAQGTQTSAVTIAAVTPSGTDRKVNLTVSVSKPANGTNFVAGERATVAITVTDQNGRPFDRANDFSQFRMTASGPMETADTVSASKLLNATNDRTQPVHHAVDLITNADVKAEGAVFTYQLQAVSDEKPGTYILAVRAVTKAGVVDGQAASVTTFQVGTPDVQSQIIDPNKCAACHLGADSGKFYFAHIDPSKPGQTGSWATDQYPVLICKTCHNNEGYAAYTSPADGKTKIPDPIVKRIHGIHYGEDLKAPQNIDPKTGVFRDYTEVVFPADIRNCTSCHADERWKTQPSQLACGTCHDSTWFGDVNAVPQGYTVHPGGSQPNDSACATCHPADKGGVKSVAEAHAIPPPAMNKINVSLTPPANGKYYAAGDKPVVTITILDDSGKPIDHSTVDNTTFSTAALLVSGNRANTVPVLTNAARNGSSVLRVSVSSTIAASGTETKGWTFKDGDTFKIAVNGGAPVELGAPAGLQTPNAVRDWLKSKLKDVTVTASATSVTIKSNLQGAKSEIDIYDSAVTRIMGWKPGGTVIAAGGNTPGVTMEPYVNVAKASYPSNDLRKLSDPLDYADPNVTRNTDNITYQLYDVAGLPAGTYSIYALAIPASGKVPGDTRVGLGFMNFQVGTATEEKQPAGNCTSCHGDTIWHLTSGPVHPAPFEPDYCKSCHDYGRPNTGDGFANHGGTSLNGWSGFGAVPLVRRIHGIHFGKYLEAPQEIYANKDEFGGIIFPQDVRNCNKCHAGNDSWIKEPSRLACNACHDSPEANAHAIQMTQLVVPNDVWSLSNIQTCVVCHGPGRDFAADKVHNISSPYKPPYPREPAE